MPGGCLPDHAGELLGHGLVEGTVSDDVRDSPEASSGRHESALHLGPWPRRTSAASIAEHPSHRPAGASCQLSPYHEEVHLKVEGLGMEKPRPATEVEEAEAPRSHRESPNA